MQDHSKGGERMESRDHERDVEIRLHSSIRHPEQEQETHEMQPCRAAHSKKRDILFEI